jgi:hypothetical protein
VAQVLRGNERLRVNNDALREEIEELKEMVEILKARGRSGRIDEGAEAGEQARGH